MAPSSAVDVDDVDEEAVVTTGGKPSYSLVRLADDESLASSSLEDETPRWRQILQHNIIPDESFEIKEIRILDGVEAVRFLKFVGVTFVGIVLIHWFVALMVSSQRRTRVCYCVSFAANQDAIQTSILTPFSSLI